MRQAIRAVTAWLIAATLAGGGRAALAQGEPQLPREGGMPVAAQRGEGTSPLLSGQNPFLGGVPTGGATPEILPLSLAEAVSRGLAHNLGVILGEQSRRGAEGGRWQALSGLLPSAGLRVSQSNQKINLQEFGFPVGPGQSPIIGPFDVAALRLGMSVPVFDYAAIQETIAGSRASDAAGHALKDARDQVVFVASALYLQAVNAASRIEAVKAQLTTAQTLYNNAVSMKQSGLVAGIDVLRAQVQVQSLRQRVIFQENELAKAKLALQRAIGIPLEQEVRLTDELPYAALEGTTLDSALQLARESREDLRALTSLVRAAEAHRDAAVGTALPTLRLNAEVGRSSNTWDSLLGTYAVSATLNVPIFQGGRVKGRVLQADAQLLQQRAQLQDLQARVDFEVRGAWLDLQSADQRVQVARSAADVANQQLVQAQDRFTAGVSSNIEVVQAQEAVATAAENLIGALSAHNLAKLALARASGVSEEQATTTGRTR